MKAIIEVSRRGSIFRAAAQQVASARQGRSPDFRLSFESASLFAELTPARLDLLDTLRRAGPCSVYALAKAAGRNYSNVHTDASRLEELGLVERSQDGSVGAVRRGGDSASAGPGRVGGNAACLTNRLATTQPSLPPTPPHPPAACPRTPRAAAGRAARLTPAPGFPDVGAPARNSRWRRRGSPPPGRTSRCAPCRRGA